MSRPTAGRVALLGLALAGVLSAAPDASPDASATAGGVRPSHPAVVADPGGVAVSLTLTNESPRRLAPGHARLYLVSGDRTHGLGRPRLPAIGARTSAVVLLAATPSPRTTDGRYAVVVCIPPRLPGHCTRTPGVAVVVRDGVATLAR